MKPYDTSFLSVGLTGGKGLSGPWRRPGRLGPLPRFGAAALRLAGAAKDGPAGLPGPKW